MNEGLGNPQGIYIYIYIYIYKEPEILPIYGIFQHKDWRLVFNSQVLRVGLKDDQFLTGETHMIGLVVGSQ